MAADGAICVKAHYEPGGPASAALPTPTPEMFRDLVRAAHEKGLSVIIHANVTTGQQIAYDSGADMIAHTISDGLGPDGQLTKDANEILSRIAARGTAYQPTLQALQGFLALLDEKYLRDPRLLEVVPRDLLAWFSTVDGGRFRQQMLTNAGGEAAFRSRAALRLQTYDLVMRKLVSSKARLIFGTDTPANATYGNIPGLNGRLEMDQWIRSGVSEEQLFRALTIENAKAFQLDKDLGTIEVGKRAHLLLLRADPLANVAAYDSIDQVILKGRPMPRESFSARHLQ